MKSWYQLIHLSTFADSRGKLTALEVGNDIPFEVKRIFYMYDIISDRGGHAHKETDQLIIAMHGSFDIRINNGTDDLILHMKNPEIGLYLPKLTFTSFSNISEDAVCLVLASTHYDMSKSLRTLDDFISFIKTINHE
jgi:hypothetical protein